MQVAIVGANGRVGTELSFLLRKDGVNVVPIVRNKIGAIFLDYHGFNCRIAEVANEDDAKNALCDIDVVVVAALALDSMGYTRRSRRTNDAIMRNSVRFCKEQAKILYFSSIRAFSSNVDPGTSRVPPPYDVEKRRGENTLFKSCNKEGKLGYALRLGHVFGSNQVWTKNIVDLLSGRTEIHLQVSPDRFSNALHVPTLKEVIMTCAGAVLNPGMYSVVNCPQWSWRELFNYYKGHVEVIFHGDPEKPKANINKKVSQTVYKFMRSQREHPSLFGSEGDRRFSALRLYLPTRVEQYLQCKYLRTKASSEMKELAEAAAPIYLSEFGYRPIPGPFIPGLSETKKLLEENEKNDDAHGLYDQIPDLPATSKFVTFLDKNPTRIDSGN